MGLDRGGNCAALFLSHVRQSSSGGSGASRQAEEMKGPGLIENSIKLRQRTRAEMRMLQDIATLFDPTSAKSDSCLELRSLNRYLWGKVQLGLLKVVERESDRFGVSHLT